jgi:uncharacterized RDD family membrane protein YckC
MAGLDDFVQLDTDIEIVTPENIAFRYRIAGPFRRAAAYLVDLLIGGAFLAVLFVVLIAGFTVILLPGVGIGLFLVATFFVSWFYGALFEVFWNGQTPGKRLLKIRAVNRDGQPISATQAVLRNFMRGLDTILFGHIGFLSMFFTSKFQRLGDLMVDTIVVVEDPQVLYGVVTVNEPAVLQLAQLIPPGFRASRTMAKALATYVIRRNGFGWGRRIEIARHLAEPLRQRFNLPATVSYDLLLCALYHRTFITDRPAE